MAQARDAKVYVNGTRVPAGDVDVHWRREGPAAATSYCEAEVISPYEGVDYIEAFKGPEIGFIAQEVAERLPQFVGRIGDYLGIRYGDLLKHLEAA